MALKSYKPITPSLRQLVIVDRDRLWKGKPVKALTEGKHNTGGRNNHGHITSRHMAAGTSAGFASSTSSAASSTCRRRSSGWSTTPTAPLSSR